MLRPICLCANATIQWGQFAIVLDRLRKSVSANERTSAYSSPWFVYHRQTFWCGLHCTAMHCFIALYWVRLHYVIL